MERELLDFVPRPNFEFLKFGSVLPEERKPGFFADCEKILEYAHETVKDMCLLGYRLKELKCSATWQYVTDPETGREYCYDNFAEFCGYAFGFSKTKVSNLLAIAEFVKLNGENIDFIDKKYAGYSTSQLIELSSVYEWMRGWFSPAQTVSEMRLIKRQLSYAWQSGWTPEEALAEAKRRAEAEKSGVEEASVETPVPAPVESAKSGESDVGIEEKEPEAEVSDVGQTELTAADVNWLERIIEENRGRYDFGARAGRRKFLSDYRNWSETLPGPLAESKYSYFLGNGSELLAVEERTGTGAIDDRTQEIAVRYYFRFSVSEDWFSVTKAQLEEYLAVHEKELRYK